MATLEQQARGEYRYNRLTWPEMNEAIGQHKVVILPTGATEQHGRHLPLDVDVFLTESVCLEAGKRNADRVLVLPPVSYGLNLHHIDFPGTIHIEPEVFIAFCLNITKSVAYHGFEKILIVNGHGSNGPLVDLVARKTTLATESICVAVNYASLTREAFDAVRGTEVIAHADEFETSLYLYLDASRVQMDHAGKGDDVACGSFSSDSLGTYPVRFSDYWSRWTKLGVHGDATTATAEKGRIIFEAAVTGLGDVVNDLHAWNIAPRTDQHTNAIQSSIEH